MAAATQGAADEHAHGNPDDEPAPLVVTLFTEELELFLEYPRLHPGVAARFLAHFTLLASGENAGEPLRDGVVRLQLSQGGKLVQEISAQAPTRDGLFIPEWTVENPGEYAAQLIVESEAVHASIPLPPMLVHANLAAAKAAAHEQEHAGPGVPDDAIQFLMEQQWSIGLLTAPIERRVLREELRVNGQVELPSDAYAELNTPLAGILMAPAGGNFPQLGESVVAGQELARIQPPMTLGDHAQALGNRVAKESLAMELALRDYDLRTKRRELMQQTVQGKTTLSFANKSLQRITSLREKSLGTVEQLESAQRDRELAVSQLLGFEAQQEAYTEAQATLKKLGQGLQALGDLGEPSTPASLSLRAPITGIIQHIDRVPGEAIGEQETVLEILDLNRVWVAAHVSEFDLSKLSSLPVARVKFESNSQASYDLGKPLPRRVSNFDPRSRTLALTYEFDNRDAQVRAAMQADVFIETGSAIEAASVPVAAIVKEDGRPIAFVVVNGEAFQKRQLKLGLRSGEYVQVLEGLRSGERVVTKGAYLLKLASADPAAFGHGHAH